MDIDYDTIDLFSDDEQEIEQELDEDGQPIDYDLELTEDLFDEEYDQAILEENLEEYLKSCEDKLMTKQIDDYTFILENLIIKYKQALLHRRFNIETEIDKKKIKRLRELKGELEIEFSNGIISELDFTRKYYNLLNSELEILLANEDYSLKSTKIKMDISKDFNESIDDLIKSEEKYFKQIAKERNISWPEKLKINRKESKLKQYLNYYLELEKARKEVLKYIPGYKLRTIEKKHKDEDAKWVIDIPNTLKIEELKKEYLEKTQEPIIHADTIDEIQMKNIKSILSSKSREELLNCITEQNMIEKLSYIESLKMNNIPVMKFREYPETYEKLEKILGEEAKYYRITKEDLLKDFNKEFNDTGIQNIKKLPMQFQPTFSVKIKDKTVPTDLPEDLYIEYNIKPSKQNYSFLLKINEIPKVNKKVKVNKYVEVGSVVSISLKPEYFKTTKVLPGIIDERYYNIVKPLSDDLYEEIKSKNMGPLNTDIVKVYELHIPVTLDDKTTTKLIRRYEIFEDYLSDLRLILNENAQILEQSGAVRSADILYTKILKIEKYLETGEDPEYIISNKYSLNQVLENQDFIDKQRNIGKNKLREYIFQFYPNNENFIDTLEQQIFNYNHKFYVNNIDRILFIFKEFSESLENYINGSLSFIELIGMEIPLYIPKDDLPNIYEDIPKSLKTLYEWMPESSYYLNYKEKLEEVGNDIIKFKSKYLEISSLEIDQIYFEMIDYKNWEKSKLLLRTLQIPKGKNPMKYMLEFLRKERSKLMCRRIYRPAKIGERIQVRQDLYRIFKNCNLENFLNEDIINLCETIEDIIYSYSLKPDLYYYHVDIVKKGYKNLCEILTTPKEILPYTTEFIIKAGDLDKISIKRLNYIVEVLNSENEELLLEFFTIYREEELLAYQRAIIEQQNKAPDNNKQKLIKAINIIMEKNKQEKKEIMLIIAENTYISPIITNIIPKISNGADRWFIPEYYIVGENLYLYGGNFPEFYHTQTKQRNYTDEEIYSLAIMLNIEYKEDILIEDLYKLCIKQLKLSSDENKQIYPKQAVLDYSPTIIKPKKYLSYINYIIRPRIGVKPPGEVYIVYIDKNDIQYAIPFKYSDKGIPVYSSKFLEDDIKKYYYIEGPCEFEDTSDDNFAFSSMYIFVEYSDSYGKTRMFREGVNTKLIKKSPSELFDACNRYKNEIDCNDVNSYGLNKMKCKFINGKCQSIKTDLYAKELLIKIDDVKFTRNVKGKQIIDYNKMKLWKDAIEKANNYIIKLTLIKKLNVEEIKQLSYEQRIQLTNYYKLLMNYNKKENLSTIIESPNYDNQKQQNDILEIQQEEQEEQEEKMEGIDLMLKRREIKFKPEKELELKTIKLPKLVMSNTKLNVRQLIIGNKYLLEDNLISILLEITDEKLIFQDGKELNKNEAIIRKITSEEKIEYEYVKISNENLILINYPPSLYKYIVVDKKYETKGNDIIVTSFYDERNSVPLDILYQIYMIHQRKKEIEEITTEVIFETMAKTLNCKYIIDSNGLLESLDIFPATLEAKVYALKYSVDLLSLSKKIKETIELKDVINEYNQVLPTVKSITEEIIAQLRYGILNEDYKLLEKFLKIAGKQKVNDVNTELENLIQEANEVILSKGKKEKIVLDLTAKEKRIEKEKEKKKKEKEKDIEKGLIENKVEETKKMTYAPKKRKGKKEED